jgi:chromate reductase
VSSTIRIIGFSGCVREQSHNKAALHFVQEFLPQDAELEIISLEDLPTFQQISESAAVSAFKEKIARADAVLIAAPEYKGMLPHALSNALAWLAGSEVLVNKPTAIMGVGRQSESAHAHLRQLLASLQAKALHATGVYVTFGDLQNEATQQQLQAMLADLVQQARSDESLLIR